MNINKLTKAELINKIDQLKKEKLDIKVKNNSANKINDDNKTSFYSIFSKIKTLILSLTFVGIFSQVFKNYKTVRVILKAANYIIITIFGISIFDAFGLGFITKFLGELKYIFGSIVTYLTDSTFYTYLMGMFNVVEEKDSIRTTYKKPVEIDWKAEFEKAERQREIDKWKERYAQDKEDGGVNKKTIALLLLLLSGSIATWYYGPELLNIFSPVWNMRDLIKKVLRGWRPGDDDDDNNSIDNNSVELYPEVRNISPDMMVYSSETIKPEPPVAFRSRFENPEPVASTSQIERPTAANAQVEKPDVPDQVKPNSLLEQIKLSKSLKSVKTKAKDVASSNKLVESLSTGLDKIRKANIEEEDIQKDIGEWDNSSEITPTQSVILDKADLGKVSKKSKFLDSISRDDEKIMSPSNIANILTDITKKFPNLSQETLEKLSTVEGLKNRHKIIESLSEDELKTNIDWKASIAQTKTNISDADLAKGKGKITEPFSYLITEKEQKERGIENIYKLPLKPKLKLSDLDSEKDIEKINLIISKSKNLSSTQVIDKIKDEYPNYDEKSYRDSFLKATEEEINSGKTEEKRMEIKRKIEKADLEELSSLTDKSDLRSIKEAINENYTHNSLINSIKNKASFSSIRNKEDFETVSSKLNPDALIDNLIEHKDDEYINSVITNNIDNKIQEIIDKNPNANKQEIIEKLIQENHSHKDEILRIVQKSMNKQLEVIETNISEKDTIKLRKQLQKEDIKELQSLAKNRTEDQIKTSSYINKTHNELLQEIKSKVSDSSFNTEHLDNTMNLFD